MEGAVLAVIHLARAFIDLYGQPQVALREQRLQVAARAGQQGGFMIEGGGDVSHAKSGSGRRLPGRDVRPG